MDDRKVYVDKSSKDQWKKKKRKLERSNASLERKRKFNKEVLEVATIHFNSKTSGKWRKLSNFYGNVEFEYTKDRFLQPKVKEWLDGVREAITDPGVFLAYLKRLQTAKKWTEKKENYWFDAEGLPIRGIVAKLIGSCARETMMKRRSILRSMLVEQKILLPTESLIIKDNLPCTGKLKLMKKLLHEKFSEPPYRKLLLSTGNSILHEKPIRGNGTTNLWTYRKSKDKNTKITAVHGGDMLGKLLMDVREEIRVSQRGALELPVCPDGPHYYYQIP